MAAGKQAKTPKNAATTGRQHPRGILSRQKSWEIPGVGTREGPGIGTRGCFFGHPAVGCRSLLKTCGKGLMDNHDLGLPHLGVLIAG